MKKIKTSKVLLNHFIEFIFIFSSVYFAFWLTNYGDTQRIKKIEIKAVASVYEELQTNIAQLKTAYAFHEEIRNQLFIYADSIDKKLIIANQLKPNEHLSKIFTRTANSLGFPNLSHGAWDMLQHSEAYVLLDYELSSQIGRLYSIQESGAESTIHMIAADIFGSKSLFHKDESEAIIFLTAFAFRELEGQEQYLLKASEETLKILEENYSFLKDN